MVLQKGFSNTIPWHGLPTPASQIAVFVLGVAVAGDVVVETLEALRSGIEALGSSTSLLDAWDLIKALLVFAGLCLTARRHRSSALYAFALLFLLIGIEDQVRVHSSIGAGLASLLRIENWSRSFTPVRANALAEFAVVTTVGVLGTGLAWTRRLPRLIALRRARLAITALLALLFLFAAVIDLAGTFGGYEVLALVDEIGERCIISLAIAYTAGLVSIRKTPDRS